MTVEAFAPAKINLTLHVTGQRADGYHLLQSLVVFADVGDRVTARAARVMSLDVRGPMARGVPADQSNLVWRAAEALGVQAHLTLEKHLPAAAGIGGGSSDAAAALRALVALAGRNLPVDHGLSLGADVPVCLLARAAVMEGIGEVVSPVEGLPELPAVLVNPGVEVSTPSVFKSLARKDNPPMAPVPTAMSVADVAGWATQQRNDLEPPAVARQPVIGAVLAALADLPGALMVRMSGSGATCFALFDTQDSAEAGAAALRAACPAWWVRACRLR